MSERLFEGRTCIISGVGPGVGRATARAFAREGAAVVLGARNEQYLDEVVETVRAEGGEAAAVVTDITRREDCEELVGVATQLFDGLDVLVNNAGFRSDREHTTIEDADFDHWRHMFDVNLYGTLRMTQCALPALRARGGGAVVFVNTMMIRKVRPTRADYVASRSALLSASQVLARECGVHGTRVNSVVPGWIWGPHVQRLAEATAQERGISSDEVYEEIASQTSLKRLATSEDVADAIVYLASDRAGAITGQTLDVNCGEVFA